LGASYSDGSKRAPALLALRKSDSMHGVTTCLHGVSITSTAIMSLVSDCVFQPIVDGVSG
jgi:hypothetical protein